MRKYKAIMHFNKAGSTKNRPWTVHFRGVCHLVRKIVCEVPMISEWKPEKPSNPRAFFTAHVHEILFDKSGTAFLLENRKS